MLNSADYVFAWLGLLAIGAAPAMINHNLAAEALLGCVRTSNAKLLLVDGNDDLVKRVADVQDVPDGLQSQGVITLQLAHVKGEIGRMSSAAPDDTLRNGLQPGDPMGLFYTRQVEANGNRYPFNLIYGKALLLTPQIAAQLVCRRLAFFP